MVELVCKKCKRLAKVKNFKEGQRFRCKGCQDYMEPRSTASKNADASNTLKNTEDSQEDTSLNPTSNMVTMVEAPSEHTDETIDVPLPDSSPDIQSRFKISGEIARGGMGVVFDGRDQGIHRPLAIKSIRDDVRDKKLMDEKFMREAQIQAQLEHPNICPVHSMDVDEEGKPFFTMKRIQGQSMLELIKDNNAAREENEEPKYSLFELLDIFKKVCQAISFAHSRGVIHRDLKPANIMIGEYGEVLVVDWGLAKIMKRKGAIKLPKALTQALSTEKETIAGTPAYMPPEQAQGMVSKMDERSDIYTLGGILYTLLTGLKPIDGPDAQTTLELCKRNKIIPPSKRSKSLDIPPELEACCMKALAGSRKDRYQNANELIDDVDAFMAGKTLAAVSYSPLQLATKWVQRNKPLAFTAIGSFLVILLGTIFFVANLAIQIERARDAEAQAKEALTASEDAKKTAEAERDNARAAEQLAKENRKKAQEAQKEAELALAKFKEQKTKTAKAENQARTQTQLAQANLAKGLIAQGDSMGLTNQWSQAKEVYGEAYKSYVQNKMDLALPRLALWNAYHHAPPPIRSLPTPKFQPTSVAISANGRLSAYGGEHKDVFVYDNITNRLLTTLKGHTGNVTALAFLPQRGQLLSGGADGNLIHWNVENGSKQVFTGHKDTITSIDVSAQGKMVVTGGNDALIHLWNIGSKRLFKTFRGHQGFVTDVAFVGSGKQILSSSTDKTVRLWTVADNKQANLIKYKTAMLSVAVHPNGGSFAVSGNDNEIFLHRLDKDRSYRRLAGHQGDVRRVRYDHSGRRLISIGDKRALVWNTSSGDIVRSFTHHDTPIVAMGTNRRSSQFITASEDKRMLIWSHDYQTVTQLMGQQSLIHAVDYSPDHDMLAYGHTNKAITLIDARTGRQLYRWGDTAKVLALGKDAVAYANGNQIKRRGLLRMQPWPELPGHDKPVKALLFHPSQPWLISAGADNVIKGWDNKSGKLLFTLKGHRNWVTKLAISSDNRTLASGSDDNMIKLWDLNNKREIRTLKGHENQITALAFSADGQSLYSGDEAGKLFRWQTNNGKLLNRFEERNTPIRSIGVLHKANMIAVEGKEFEMVILDQELEQVRSMRVYQSPLDGIFVSRDGWNLFSASNRALSLRFNLWAGEYAHNNYKNVDKWTNAVAKNRRDYKAWKNVGDWYASYTRWTWALPAYTQAEEARRASVPARSMGYALHQNKQYEPATPHFHRAVQQKRMSPVKAQFYNVRP